MRTQALGIFIIYCLWSCQSRQQETNTISTIDTDLQVQTSYILENKLSELNALSGQAIIMEVQTEQIKAMVGLKEKIVQLIRQARNYLKHKLWD